MKVITIKRKNIIKALAVSMFAFILCIFTTSFGMQHYYKVDFSTGIVTATTLNVRSGPGTQYKIVATVKKNEYIRVFAGVGEWYIVQVEGDYVGAVSKKYVKAVKSSTSSGNTSTGTNTGTSNGTTNSTLTADEQETFNLINKQRTNNGLQALKIDNEVQTIARVKAQDMVNNNYFSHNSPTYGTPFKM